MSTLHTAPAEGGPIEFALERADRRTLALHVAPDGSLRVRAPRRVPEAVIVRFVTERSAWIARTRLAVASREARRLPPPDAADVARARRVFAGRLTACWQAFGRRGEVMPELRVRVMRTRWGSLSPQGRITLNAQLVRASEACIDSVIFHELCHLRVRGHGPDFYRELARYVPEWKARRAELRELL